MSSREKFETWAASKKSDLATWKRGDKCGEYKNPVVTKMWEGYQEGAASMQAERDQMEAKCAALAAENAALKHAMAVTLEHVSVMDAGQAGVAAMIINDALHHSETPATDAFIAEQRAQGVTMCSTEIQKQTWDESEGDGIVAALDAMEIYATQLRQGGAA